jgi:hypothetical protein
MSLITHFIRSQVLGHYTTETGSFLYYAKKSRVSEIVVYEVWLHLHFPEAEAALIVVGMTALLYNVSVI